MLVCVTTVQIISNIFLFSIFNSLGLGSTWASPGKLGPAARSLAMWNLVWILNSLLQTIGDVDLILVLAN